MVMSRQWWSVYWTSVVCPVDIAAELVSNADVGTVVVCVLDSSVVCPVETAAELVSKGDVRTVVVCVLDTSVVCPDLTQPQNSFRMVMSTL